MVKSATSKQMPWTFTDAQEGELQHFLPPPASFDTTRTIASFDKHQDPQLESTHGSCLSASETASGVPLQHRPKESSVVLLVVVDRQQKPKKVNFSILDHYQESSTRIKYMNMPCKEAALYRPRSEELDQQTDGVDVRQMPKKVSFSILDQQAEAGDEQHMPKKGNLPKASRL